MILTPVPDSILRAPATQVVDPMEALQIVATLENQMRCLQGCLGLAAPQIGIPRAVAIIRHPSAMIDLINPRIVKTEGEVLHKGEGCMSYPGRRFDVVRHKDIWIESLVVRPGRPLDDPSFPLACYPVTAMTPDPGMKFVSVSHTFCHGQEEDCWGGLIAMAVQHEIDHLNGIVLPYSEKATEVQDQPQQAKSEKVGRNDPCPCGSGRKYKKCCLK